jgi:hypothetical protein
MQSTFVADLGTHMEIVIAIELIVGAVFVVGFWFKNPELKLSRRLSQQLLDSYDDEENDDARVHPSNVWRFSHSGLNVSLSFKDTRP